MSSILSKKTPDENKRKQILGMLYVPADRLPTLAKPTRPRFFKRIGP